MVSASSNYLQPFTVFCEPRGGGRGRGPPRRPEREEKPEIDPNNPTLQPVPRGSRYGRTGEKTQLMVNSYAAELQLRNPEMFHYDLKFGQEKEVKTRGGRGGRRGRGGGRGEPQKKFEIKWDEKSPPMPICLRVVKKIEENESGALHGAKLAHDGKANVYTSTDPGWGQNEFTVQLDGETRKVQFRLVGKVNRDHVESFMKGTSTEIPQRAVQCIDTILRTQPLRTMIYTGKVFTMDTEGIERIPLGQGCEAWATFYQAFKAQDSGFHISFDVGCSAFYKQQSVYDFAVEILTGRSMEERQGNDPFPSGISVEDLHRLNNEIRGLRVVAAYQPVDERRPKAVKKITSKNAFEQEIEEGKGTVAAYFESINEQLRYPQLPCLDIGSGKSGSQFYPLEKALICGGQQRKRQMTDEMHERMVKASARDPTVRTRHIEAMLAKVNQITGPFLDSFGVKVNTSPVTVQGRILKPPQIEFRNEWLNVADPGGEDLSWSIKGREFAFINGELDNWGVLVLASLTKPQVLKFIQAMITTATAAGMTVKKPRIEFGFMETAATDLMATYNKCNADLKPGERKCRLILVIKEDARAEDYNQIKNIGETHLGIPTQCVVGSNAREPKELYCRNVLLKMNAKLGGVNWRIGQSCFNSISNRFGNTGLRYMIVGLSITHPPAMGNRPDTPSVATAVASLDPTCGEWAGVYRKQASTEDGIADAGKLVGDLLAQFHDRHGFLPENLLIYREGVSDGQFARVRAEEINRIYDEAEKIATTRMQEGYKPKIAFIVMQKKHNTRFFPVSGERSDPTNNCVPGTVVDRTIAHSVNYDFYLIAHNSVQGTARPIRYTLLKDDFNFEPDEIQTLTYHLCFTFCRSTRSISIVPAVAYAELLSTRIRAYLSARQSVSGTLGKQYYGPNVPDSISDDKPSLYTKTGNDGRCKMDIYS